MISKAAAATSYTSSGIYALTGDDITTFVGAGFVALTYFTNLYFKIRADKRAEAITKAEIEKAAD